MAQCVTQIPLGDTLVLKWYHVGSQRMEEYLLLHEGINPILMIYRSQD